MKRVLIGMSGGVDSSVAAVLLKEQGYEVTGVTLKLWDCEEERLNGELINKFCESLKDAEEVCEKIGISHQIIDLNKNFKEIVVEYFINEYIKGKTPNPCIICNKKIKFGLFYDIAKEMGADYIATGHYARIENEKNIYLLKKAVDERKDQSYFLYSIGYEKLKEILMPLGKYRKDEVRNIAEKSGLKIYGKKDSQEICFINKNGYQAFLEKHLNKKKTEGYFIDEKGNTLGKHKGIWNYTPGQRKGLGIALGKPVFVKKIDSKNGNIILASECELYEKEIYIKDICYMTPEPISYEKRLSVKIRYGMKPQNCLFVPDEDYNKGKLIFDEPGRAPASGQSAVLYDGNTVICGGIITEKFK